MTKILIAEDERDIRDLITFTLTFGGYEVVAASNGEEAVNMAKQELPDLILLDVRMPRMTGYEACAAIKAVDRLKDIPIIFLSAKGQESEIQAGLQAGATEYLLKPFAPDQLTTRIKTVLARGPKGAEAQTKPDVRKDEKPVTVITYQPSQPESPKVEPGKSAIAEPKMPEQPAGAVQAPAKTPPEAEEKAKPVQAPVDAGAVPPPPVTAAGEEKPPEPPVVEEAKKYVEPVTEKAKRVDRPVVDDGPRPVNPAMSDAIWPGGPAADESDQTVQPPQDENPGPEHAGPEDGHERDSH